MKTSDESKSREFKSGFVGIVGPTNSGKSTLMNSLVGKKVSIVSPRAQTTYHGVRGVLTTPNDQIIFIDTPGFQRHPEHVARLLNKVADRNAKDCDLLIWVFDATTPRVVAQCEKLADKIKSHKPVDKSICVLNKIDKVARVGLLPMLKEVSHLNLFAEIIPISAKKSDGLDRLLAAIRTRLPEGQLLFPSDTVTDRSRDFMISELVREKIYAATKQEIPYSVWVETENWAEDREADRVPTLRAVIHVDSPSRKGILIGKGGEMLKRIGTDARTDIEKMVGHQICLKLHVDVQKEWKSDSHLLHRYLELE